MDRACARNVIREILFSKTSCLTKTIILLLSLSNTLSLTFHFLHVIIKWNLMKKQKDCRTALRLTKEEKDKLYLIDSNLSKAVRKCIQAYEIDYEVLRGAINRTE